MAEDFDRDRIIGYLFDPTVSSILSELEDGSKDAAYLSQTLGMQPEKIRDVLSYLIEHKFIAESTDNPPVYTADGQRLAKVMENDENYQSAVDGLAKLDGFLN